MRSSFEKLLWVLYPLVYDVLWDTALTAKVAEAVLRELPVGAPVEEVGAGTGLVTRRLVEAGVEVEASEPNPRMRRRFMARLPSTPVTSSPLERLSANSAGAPGSVLAANVVHLTRNPTSAVVTLRRRAGIGGRVVIVTPAPDATLASVGRALRECGEPRRSVLRFVVLHALLSPLTLLAGGGLDERSLATLGADDAMHSRCICDVSRVVVLAGQASREASRERTFCREVVLPAGSAITTNSEGTNAQQA